MLGPGEAKFKLGMRNPDSSDTQTVSTIRMTAIMTLKPRSLLPEPGAAPRA